MDNPRSNLADPESLLGMLQRGRGKGYLAALEVPPETVWPLLFECITHDPRLDRDVEQRAELYAGVIAATHMDLEPLRSHLRQEDSEEDLHPLWLSLPLATLECLARGRADSAALSILRDYMSYGQDWARILAVLAEIDTQAALEQTVAVLCRRVRSDTGFRAQFQAVVRECWEWYCQSDEEDRARPGWFLPICEPWKTLCTRNTELADLFREVGIPYDQSGPPRNRPSDEYLAGLSLQDLFARADKENHVSFWRVLPDKVSAGDEEYLLQQLATGDSCRMILAFRGLGKLGTARAFDALKTYLEASENADRRMFRYAHLAFAEIPGSLTLDTARQWFRRPEGRLQIAAGEVLENHATREDVPLLLEALCTPATLRGEDWRLCSILDALARFDEWGWIPELEQVFCQAPHCFWRYRAARAMAVTAPVEFTSRYAFECLWDCHADTRAVGCDMVHLSMPGALERIREIAADTNEYDDVRQAAQERLEGF